MSDAPTTAAPPGVLQSELHGVLANGTPTARAMAARALGTLGGDDRLERLAVVALLDGDSTVRAAAVHELNRAAAPPAVIRRAAAVGLRHEDKAVRGRAAWSLGKLGTDGIEDLPTLLQIIRSDPGIDARFGAVQAIGRIGHASTEALDGLAVGLRDIEPDVRAETALAVARLGPAAAWLLADLQPVLDDDDALAREHAALAISRLDGDRTEAPSATPAARPAAALPDVEALLAQCDDSDPHVRGDAAWQLGRPGVELDQAATARLIRHALTDPDADARWGAVVSLGRAGCREPPLIDALVEMADREDDPDMRAAAATALGATWRAAPAAALAALGRALEDEDGLVRLEARAAVAAVAEG